jgi:predicted transcriptional regulator
MARDRQDITEAEMGVMQILWDRGPSATRQIADAIRGGPADSVQYATVQKQLERLEAKGFVRRDRTLFVHVFSAAVEREELIGRRIREMADKLCGGSLAPILSHLARSQPLSNEERRALRELIDAPPEQGATAGETKGATTERRGKRKSTR